MRASASEESLLRVPNFPSCIPLYCSGDGRGNGPIYAWQNSSDRVVIGAAAVVVYEHESTTRKRREGTD